MKLSIALPAYNRCNFLAEQFDSLLSQTRLPDELIVGDDCSTDRTVDIVKRFAARAPFPVRWYINERNQGYNSNLERAIGLCSGDIIVLCDDDDVCLPNKLKLTEQEFLDTSAAGLLVSNSFLVDEKLKSLELTLWQTMRLPERKVIPAEPIATLAKHFVANGHVISFRANLRPYILPFPRTFPPRIFCDIWISLVLASLTNVICAPEPLVLHRLHGGQIAGVQSLVSSSERVRFIKSSEKAKIGCFVPFVEEVVNRVTERDDDSVSNPSIQVLSSWLKHLKMQSELPTSRLLRVFSITSALLTGSYHRYSRGFLTAARDLLILQ